MTFFDWFYDEFARLLRVAGLWRYRRHARWYTTDIFSEGVADANVKAYGRARSIRDIMDITP